MTSVSPPCLGDTWQVMLTDRAMRYSNPRKVGVTIDALGMEERDRLETGPLAPPGSGVLKFNWKRELVLPLGSPGFAALQRALDGPASGMRINFRVNDVAGRVGEPLGEAYLDLSPLLRGRPNERETQQLTLLDTRGLNVGHAIVSVRIVEAIRMAQAATKSAPRVVSVVVPFDHMPGEPVQVDADGQTYEVPVPRGVRRGATFEVELPAPPPPEPARPAARSDRRNEPTSPSDRGRGRAGGDVQPGGAAAATAVDRRKAYDSQRRVTSTDVREPPAARDSPNRRSPNRNSGDGRDDPYRREGRDERLSDENERAGGGGRRWPSAEHPQNPPADVGGGSSRRWPSSSQPSMSATMPAGGAAGGVGVGGGGSGGFFPNGTAPTEVEHAMIVAFERLGQAQAQMSTHTLQRSKLDKELVKSREEVVHLTKENRSLKAQAEAQAHRLAELGAAVTRVDGASGYAVGGGAPAAGSGARAVGDVNSVDALKKRLGNFQAAKQEELRSLNQKLAAAHTATETEGKERIQAERQAADALRRLTETQAALDQERRHVQAVGTERERLQTMLAEAQLSLKELTLMYDAPLSPWPRGSTLPADCPS